MSRLCFLVLAVLVFASAAAAESRLMRFADVHGEQIVFTYEDDLWLASAGGGDARRITNDGGAEVWARFSPDGKQIAFTAQYDGGTDVYVMDARGGVPKRLTFHPAVDRVLDWFPDGQAILFRSNRDYPDRGEEVYRVSIAGGLPEKLPVDRAGLATLSPDGQQIAYNRISREAATWKRYVGGMAQNIWLGSLEKQDYRIVADSDWTNNYPMWQGDAVYFTSDRDFGTLNLFKYDTQTEKVTRLTEYQDYDVKYPSIGPGAIIYQYAEELYLYDLQSGRPRKIAVEIPTDAVRMRPEYERVAPTTGSFGLSPSGKRVLLEARGEILNFPAEDGAPVNLTHTPGTREKNAAWSPDGRWIAFISDKTGEEEIYLVDQKGAQEGRQLSSGGLGFRMQLVWSPDSKYLIFADKFMRLNLLEAETGQLTVIDQSDYDDAWERWGIQDYCWSPDARWIAYTKQEQSMCESIFLYSLDTRTVQRVTGDMTQDWSPAFDPQGKYLYFLSNRTFEPLMCAVDQNHIFLEMARPYLVLLQADARSPFFPKDSEEEVKPAAEEEARDTAEEAEKGETGERPGLQKPESTRPVEEPGPVAEAGQPAESDQKTTAEGKAEEPADSGVTKIDLDGLAERVLVAEGVPAGNYFRLEATADGFVYLKKPQPEFTKYQNVNDHTGGSLELYSYKVADKSNKRLISGIANYHLSADGKKLIYRAGSTYGVLDVGKEGKVGDGKIDLGAIRVTLDRPAEFLQMFDEAWRIQRDWFYDENLHGVDWAAMRAKYRPLVRFCGTRGDLNYLIGEMISELNIGHTYVMGGDLESSGRQVSTGLLGCEFARTGGAEYYQIAHIIPGTPGSESERAPLREPGCGLRAGQYLIAIDGAEVKTSDNPFRLLQNKANTVVTISYNDQPAAEGARTARIRTIGSERQIRHREWVERNRARVEQLSGGRLGYVHIPDMGENGLREFARYYYPQYARAGFIVDARYNGGGFTGDMLIDRLERRIWSMSLPREGLVWRDPERVFAGPWIVLINEDTGSNGEMFAEAIKIKKLAPVLGMRTWGGAIGIEPHQNLVDGGVVTPPQFGLYGLDRTWLIEGWGVEPDIEVQNWPGDVLRARDAQLEAGVQNVLERLAEQPVELPAVPPYPDKSKKVQ